MRIILTLLLTLFVCASTAVAQSAATKPPTAQSARTPASGAAAAATVNVHARVPQQAVACLSVRLQQIKLDQALRLVPWEIVSAASLDEVGIDLSELERFDLLVGPIAEQPGIAGLFTSKNMVDLSRLNKELFSVSPDGKSYRMMGNRPFRDLAIVPLGESQIVVGYGQLIGPLLNAEPGAGELLKQMQRLGENGHISLVFVPGPARELLLEGARSLPQQEAVDFKVLAEKVQLVAARAQIDTNPTINLLIEAANETDAQAVEVSWNRQVEIASDQFVRGMARPSRNEEMTEAMQAFSVRAIKELRDLLRPTRKGSRLLLTIDHRAINLARGLATYANLAGALDGLTPGNRTPGGGPPRAAMQMVGGTDGDKLRQIGLAVHNFESVYKMMPGGVDSGQPKPKQLSWRVYLLPFFGDPASIQLFQQFKLDEPWDSEHNSKLLAKMPDMYRFSKAQVAAGHTVVQMPLGPGLISEKGKSVRFGNITDGLSNTIMIALSTDQAAVPWTKPEDFNPLENLELIRSDNGKMVYCQADGRVLDEPRMPPEKLKNMLTIAGGE